MDILYLKGGGPGGGTVAYLIVVVFVSQYYWHLLYEYGFSYHIYSSTQSPKTLQFKLGSRVLIKFLYENPN